MAAIVHRIGIQSSTKEVFSALTTRAGLAGWWTETTEGEGGPGGVLKFRFSAKGSEIGGFDMKVLKADPQRLVLWEVTDGPEEWIGTTVRFDLKQSGEYAIVLFRHDGWREVVDFTHHCSTKWAIYLMSLKSLIETGKGTPNPHDPPISGDGSD